jgi:hypothetical protein
MKQRLVAHHRLKPERSSSIGQAKLNADRIARMKLSCQHQADAAFP